MRSSIHISTWLLAILGGIVVLVAIAILLSFFLFQKSETPSAGEKQQAQPSRAPSVQEEIPASELETVERTRFVGLGVHMTVHVEPTNKLADQTAHWGTLTRLVALADAYEMKLSLHFSPQMAQYATQDDKRLALVHAWQRDGHEIGFHHHGLSHPVWDGYSNAPVAKGKRGYLGTMDDLMALVKPLSVNGRIEIGSSTDAQIDWPTGVLYGTNTAEPPSPADLLSFPQTFKLGNQQVTFLTKAPFAVDHGVENATLEDIELAIKTTDTYEYLGFTVTDDNLDEADFADVERLFQLLERWGARTQPIVDLLRETSE